MSRDRVLVWDGCVNVRDLGGLPLEDGGETRFRVVVRADSVRGLTERGWRALLDYGIRSVIDLRGDAEAAEDPPVSPPVPVTRVAIGPGEEWSSMRETYLEHLAVYRPQFIRAAGLIAASADPVVVHCAGGRDRTGLLVALLLDAAGVDRETIAEDHALSDDSWAPYNDAWFEAAPTQAERERRVRVAKPAGRTMIGVLEEVDRRWGGPAAYLGPTVLDTLVLRLRG